MPRFLSVFMLLALLFAQAAPGICTIAADHGSGPHDDVHASHARAGLHETSRDHPAAAGHARGPGHAAEAATAAAPSSPEHDSPCPDLARCHWAAVPAPEMAAISMRGPITEPLSQRKDALISDAPLS